MTVIAYGGTEARKGRRLRGSPGASGRWWPWTTCSSLLWLCGGFLIGLAMSWFIRASEGTTVPALSGHGRFEPKSMPDSNLSPHRKVQPVSADVEADAVHGDDGDSDTGSEDDADGKAEDNGDSAAEGSAGADAKPDLPAADDSDAADSEYSVAVDGGAVIQNRDPVSDNSGDGESDDNAADDVASDPIPGENDTGQVEDINDYYDPGKKDESSDDDPGDSAGDGSDADGTINPTSDVNDDADVESDAVPGANDKGDVEDIDDYYDPNNGSAVDIETKPNTVEDTDEHSGIEGDGEAHTEDSAAAAETDLVSGDDGSDDADATDSGVVDQKSNPVADENNGGDSEHSADANADDDTHKDSEIDGDATAVSDANDRDAGDNHEAQEAQGMENAGAGEPVEATQSEEPTDVDYAATDPTEIRAAGSMLSEEAYLLSLKRCPEVAFEPAAGPVDAITPPKDDAEPQNDKYHIAMTADCQVYGRWQVLVNYWWYTKLKHDLPDSPMGGYTRLLHCAEPDDVMHLVPTVRVDPLSDEFVANYAPVNRPWAYVQWLARMLFPERYVFMTEPDHIFLAPPPLIATPTRPAVYPFRYVQCTEAPARQFCEDERFNERQVPVEDIEPIGNSPMIISKEMLIDIAPRWDRVMRAIHTDAAATEAFGWIKEMYAFTLALANSPGGPPAVNLTSCLLAHPPYDRSVTIDAAQTTRPVACHTDKNERYVTVPVLHYTYSQDLNDAGEPVPPDNATWTWNKRAHMWAFPHLPFDMPPEGAPESTVVLLKRINEAGMSPELWRWWRANMDPPE